MNQVRDRSAARGLFLVRHGVTDWNEVGRVLGRCDVGLNERGWGEAEAVARALSEIPLVAVVASPQRRARETAEAIARMHRLAVGTDPGLDEVWVGPWQGKTWAELQGDADVQRYLEDPMYVCEAVEATVRVQERIVAVAERLRPEAEKGAVVLVSHGDPIKLLAAHYLSMQLAAFRRLGINTGSVSVFRFGAFYGQRLLVLNWKPPGTLLQLVASSGP
jgi:broad specificity phosphatase PhoE